MGLEWPEIRELRPLEGYGMYKDKDKQREANRQAKQRQRAKRVTPEHYKEDPVMFARSKGMTSQGVTVSGSGTRVIPSEQGMTKDGEMPKGEGPPRLVPGACWNSKHSTVKGVLLPKRGKDIKCFEDLPADVQVSIDVMSIVDGKPDKDEHAKRTAAAIKYQHLFPGIYELGDAVLAV